MGQACCREETIKLKALEEPQPQEEAPEPIKDNPTIEQIQVESESSSEIEVESTDSDIITEPMKPRPPLKPSTITVFDDQIEEILNKEFIKIMSEFVDKLTIDKRNIKAMISDQDYEAKQMAEEFLCIYCNKFVVPHFILGKDGIKKESVKIPQCQNCHHLSCYQCFKNQLAQENSHCTRCYLQIQSPYPKYNPPKNSDISLKSAYNEKKSNHEVSSAYKNYTQHDLEKHQLEQYNKKYQIQVDEFNKNVDNYMTFCSNKKLLNIIFNQKIVHKCQIREDEAILKANETWENVYKLFEEQMKRTGETPFQLLSQIEQYVQLCIQNGNKLQISDQNQQSSNIFDRSETIFEGGDEDEVQIDEQNQQEENNEAENADNNNEQENQDQQQEEEKGDEGDKEEPDQQNEENGGEDQKEEENPGDENQNSEQKEAEDDQQEQQDENIDNNEDDNQEDKQEENNEDNEQENQEGEQEQENEEIEKNDDQGEDEGDQKADDCENENNENEEEGKADSQLNEEGAAEEVNEEGQENHEDEAQDEGQDDNQGEDEGEEKVDNNDQENGEGQDGDLDGENKDNEKSQESQVDEKGEDLEDGEQQEKNDSQNNEKFSDQNAYNQLIQDKSDMGDFDQIMENRSDSKINSILNEDEGEQFDEVDKIEENQDEDIPDTPQKSFSKQSKVSKIKTQSNNVSMVKQETDNNQESICEIFNEDLNENKDDQSQQSKSQMSSVKQSQKSKSQMTSVKESQQSNMKSKMTSVQESQQSISKSQMTSVKESQQTVKIKVASQKSQQSSAVQKSQMTSQKSVASSSRKETSKANQASESSQKNNIIDDKSEEYSGKINEEHSNMQHTTAFETVNSKTRKETLFKNYNYDVHQLDEVDESIESFKNSQSSKQRVSQNKNIQNSIKSKLNNVELLKSFKSLNKSSKIAIKEKTQFNEAEYKEKILLEVKEELQKTMIQNKIREEEEQKIFNQKKQYFIEKLTESFLSYEFKFLDYLNHIVSECPMSGIPESFCPFRKCKKNKIPMKLNSLRKHFVNECTKITMQCFHCEDKFRRPWIPYHDCRRVYIQTIVDLRNQLNESLNYQQYQGEILKEKDEIIQVFFEERAKLEQQQRIKETIRDKMLESNYLEKMNNETQRNFKNEKKQSDLIPDQNRSISAALHSKQHFKEKKNDENLSKVEKFRKMELASQDSYYGLNKPTLQSIGVGQTQRSQYSKGIGQSEFQFQANKVVGKIREHSANRRLEPIQVSDPYKKTPSIHIQNEQNVSIKERGSQSVIHKKNSRLTIDCAKNTIENNKMSTIISNQSQVQQNKYRNNYVDTQASNNTVQLNQIEFADNYQEKRFRRDSRNSKIRVQKKQFNTQEGSEYQHKQDQIMNLQKQQILTEVGQHPSNFNNKNSIINVLDESLEIDIENQSNLQQKKLTDCIQKLQIVEKEITQQDKYIEHCISKYKQFNFNILLLLDQEKIELTNFVKNYEIKQGQFKGSLFWGLILPQVKGSFQPHGFGIFYNKINKMMQMGTFKNGLEHGQQRVIQSLPVQKRYFTQFTAINGTLNGPAMIDRNDQRIEIGNYKADKQDGTWRYRFNDGRIEQVHFTMGVLQ